MRANSPLPHVSQELPTPCRGVKPLRRPEKQSVRSKTATKEESPVNLHTTGMAPYIHHIGESLPTVVRGVKTLRRRQRHVVAVLTATHVQMAVQHGDRGTKALFQHGLRMSCCARSLICRLKNCICTLESDVDKLCVLLSFPRPVSSESFVSCCTVCVYCWVFYVRKVSGSCATFARVLVSSTCRWAKLSSDRRKRTHTQCVVRALTPTLAV